ncbi:MAG: UDP-N-acetylmuramate dehydrogenase [Bacteroidales bacterium]|nr:UDP-N-acetylmuramate dehydrogenase [Bacteroidales bacterium]
MKTYEHISLKAYNTFGIDASARRMVVLEPGDEPASLPREAPWLVLGGGSNMVFTRDYDGTVVRLDTVREVSVRADGAEVLVTAWGGMVMDELVEWTLEQGCYGLENLTAIPGTVGASVVQNVGAYGVEAKDVVEGVEVYDLQEGRRCLFSNADCRFAYRDSMFKHHPGRFLVLRVCYRLRREFVANLSYKALEGLPHATAAELRQAIADLRWGKLPRPEEHGSAGSFFKNPVVEEPVYQHLRTMHPDMPEAHRSEEGYKLSAGWLIDRAGWKGRTMGAAGVWPRNALVLYNASACTGSEVLALARAIQQDVDDKFNVRLEPEAIII